MTKKNRKKTLSLIFIIALVLAMALISFQMRKTQGFEPEPVADEIAPNIVFEIGPVQVTSTVVNTWVMILLIRHCHIFDRSLS